MMNDQQTPNLPYSNLAPTIIMAPSGNKNAIKILLGIAAVLAALLLGLLVLVLIGFETGPIALLVGLLSATIPVPLYLLLVLWIDRYESEPLWMLATAFFWGALVAVFIAFLFNSLIALIVSIVTNSLAAGETVAAV